jgi:enoyl-CoA hydratase/carnithine racemase
MTIFTSVPPPPPTTAHPLDQIDDGPLRVLTLDRPETLNAFDRSLYDAVAEALDQAGADDSVGAVLVTGAGRAFSAGQDLRDFARPDPSAGGPGGFPAFVRALEGFPKPLVAAVNGVAVGVGLTMLLHCDIVLAGASARFRAPFVSLGLCPEAGSTALLPATIGWQRTAELLYGDGWIDAATAVEWGLAVRVEPDDELMAAALTLGRSVAAQPLASLIATKRLLLDGRADAVRAARVRELDVFGRLLGGPANRAALAAFLVRREP